MLYAPKLRRADELVPPDDDDEETNDEKLSRDLDHCDFLYDQKIEGNIK